jgi:hypothetical protein
MTNIERVLEEKEVLKKVLDKTTGILLYTHNKLKIVLALSISVAAFPFFFAIWFFDNDFIFFGLLSFVLGCIGFAMFFSVFCDLFDDNLKIVKNSQAFYESFLTKKELLVLETLLSNESIKNLDKIEEVVRKKVDLINKRFIEKNKV